MWVVLAIIAFVVALIFHIAGGSVTQYVLDAELIGFICLAIHLAWPLYPWRRPVSPPQ
jgi:hypothetical protein